MQKKKMFSKASGANYKGSFSKGHISAFREPIFLNEGSLNLSLKLVFQFLRYARPKDGQEARFGNCFTFSSTTYM